MGRLMFYQSIRDSLKYQLENAREEEKGFLQTELNKINIAIEDVAKTQLLKTN